MLVLRERNEEQIERPKTEDVRLKKQIKEKPLVVSGFFVQLSLNENDILLQRHPQQIH